MILKDGSDWQPEDQDLIAWQQNFPDVDVFAELGAMEAWCESNPQKRKTKTGIKRFVTSWLNRARDKGGVSPFAAQASTNNGKILMKQWTTNDDLTHDFMKSEAFRQRCLDNFGQYMTFDGERVSRDG